MRIVTTKVKPARSHGGDISFSSICCANARYVVDHGSGPVGSFRRVSKGAITILRNTRDSVVTSNRAASCNRIGSTGMGEFGGTSDTIVRLGGNKTSTILVSGVVTRVCYGRGSSLRCRSIPDATRSAIFYVRGKGARLIRVVGSKLTGMGGSKRCSSLCRGCFISALRGDRSIASMTTASNFLKLLDFVFLRSGH